jgi:hypothetical protein
LLLHLAVSLLLFEIADAKVVTLHQMQNSFKKIIFGLFLLLPVLFAKASLKPSEALAQADSLFNVGLYTQALPLYEQLYTQDRLASPAMLLKMALIYEGLSKPTMALFMLNKYYMSRPDNAVLKKMAELAQKHQLSGYEYKETNYLITFYRQYEREIVQVIVGLLALCVLLMVYKRFVLKSISPSMTLLSFVLLGALAFLLNKGVDQTYAIIMRPDTFAYKSASGASTVVTRLPQGTRVVITEATDKWLGVKLNDKEVFVNSFCIQPVY